MFKTPSTSEGTQRHFIIIKKMSFIHAISTNNMDAIRTYCRHRCHRLKCISELLQIQNPKYIHTRDRVLRWICTSGEMSDALKKLHYHTNRKLLVWAAEHIHIKDIVKLVRFGSEARFLCTIMPNIHPAFVVRACRHNFSEPYNVLFEMADNSHLEAIKLDRLLNTYCHIGPQLRDLILSYACA